MAAARWPIVVGIAALAGGIAWYAVQDGEAPSPRHATAPADPQGPRGTGAAKAAISAPSGPSLGSGEPAPGAHPFGGDPLPEATAGADAPPIDAGPSAQRVAFAAQPRDPSWAGKTEAVIKRRLARLEGARLEAAECRQDQCELTIGGSADGVAAALGEVESTRGLRGVATSVILTAPEQRDGKTFLRVYAQFDR